MLFNILYTSVALYALYCLQTYFNNYISLFNIIFI